MSKTYTTIQYDEALLKFHSFNKRPFSLPHIGHKIEENNAVLFIMESHYTDPAFFECQYDKDNLKIAAPELFYNIKEEGFTKAFKAYLDTRQIIKDSTSSDRTLSKGKSVYRKLSSAVEEGLNLGSNSLGLDHVAVYNYFQRPSYTPGASIKVCVEDLVVAYEALKHILDAIDFRKIIFTSAKAYDCFIKKDNENNGFIQSNRKIFRGTHPRVWGNKCTYEKGITWKQWVISRLGTVEV